MPNPIALAPMSGVTDRPFRQLCRKLGAGYVVSEMLTCDLSLLKSAKSKFRLNHDGEPEPVVAQLVGSCPEKLAIAAKFNQQNGSQIIDINMGCPAKKVYKKFCGSALLAHPGLVKDILQATIAAVSCPVTLKIRLGIDENSINTLEIAKIAQDCGIAALFIHGRTRIQKYKGFASYQQIKLVKQNIDIPVIANGDIDSPQKAQQVFAETGCDGIMIGRAACGNPWIFREVAHYLVTGELLPRPSNDEVVQTMYNHVENLHQFYGEYKGMMIARSHIGWFLKTINQQTIARKLYKISNAEEQLLFITLIPI
ncbi:tRNA-dihydrouridine synthase DusB [hydrothermal vent metagenome]|uniref:tRNA-dihydrouridine synthase DusB n=1 Tax=hydrothermal vent metagenome TaxID=652676 RepID=A0A3B0VWX4_9ZZZZ